MSKEDLIETILSIVPATRRLNAAARENLARLPEQELSALSAEITAAAGLAEQLQAKGRVSAAAEKKSMSKGAAQLRSARSLIAEANKLMEKRRKKLTPTVERRQERIQAKKRTDAPKIKSLAYLFHETLREVYFAEMKISGTLPIMEEAAQSRQLKEAFRTQANDTRVQVLRLEAVFEIIGKPAQGKTCEAILGITREGHAMMDEFKGMSVLDAALLAAAQAVEHYEMARYGTLRTWARQLGLNDAVVLLDATLEEEKKHDASLNDLAETVASSERKLNLA